MSAQDNWLANVKALVDANVPPGAKTNADAYRTVAELSGLKPAYIYQLYVGVKKRVGVDAAKAIGRAFANGRDSSWIDHPPGAIPDVDDVNSVTDKSPSVAHSVSQWVFQDVPHIHWGDLVNHEVRGRFQVEVPEDAVAPDIKAGELCTFDPNLIPRPGDGVIVLDAAGRHHLRRYRDAEPGAWEAYASSEAFRTLHSARDGLRIVGVYVGSERRLAAVNQRILDVMQQRDERGAQDASQPADAMVVGGRAGLDAINEHGADQGKQAPR